MVIIDADDSGNTLALGHQSHFTTHASHGICRLAFEKLDASPMRSVLPSSLILCAY